MTGRTPLAAAGPDAVTGRSAADAIPTTLSAGRAPADGAKTRAVTDHRSGGATPTSLAAGAGHARRSVAFRHDPGGGR